MHPHAQKGRPEVANVWLTLLYQLETAAPLHLPLAAAPGSVAVPGSTLKGAVRHSAGSVALALGYAPCLRDAQPTCPVCRLFGAPGQDSALRWSDARQRSESEQDAVSPGIAVRRRRPVSRAFRTSLTGAGPGRPLLPVGAQLTGSVEGWLPRDGVASPEKTAGMLIAALSRLESLGGGRGAGEGRVTVQRIEVRFDGAVQPVAALLDAAMAQEAQ